MDRQTIRCIFKVTTLHRGLFNIRQDPGSDLYVLVNVRNTPHMIHSGALELCHVGLDLVSVIQKLPLMVEGKDTHEQTLACEDVFPLFKNLIKTTLSLLSIERAQPVRSEVSRITEIFIAVVLEADTVFRSIRLHNPV